MNELKVKAYELRQVVLDMIMKSGGGHIGGDFSVMDILVALYDRMNISPENREDPDRDYFVMSKGHSVESYYAVLADKGFFPRSRSSMNFPRLAPNLSVIPTTSCRVSR